MLQHGELALRVWTDVSRQPVLNGVQHFGGLLGPTLVKHPVRQPRGDISTRIGAAIRLAIRNIRYQPPKGTVQDR